MKKENILLKIRMGEIYKNTLENILLPAEKSYLFQ